MKFFGLASVAALATTVLAQDPRNVTTLAGTWSSGSRSVVTGSGFANPANLTFTYPKNTGVSYSFTNDMHYEIARYRFLANATRPDCITGVLQWTHGNYTLNDNGTISMYSFGDGYQQIQDPCGVESNFMDTTYNYNETYSGWQIVQDSVKGYILLLFQADGTPVAPQYLVSPSPNMLPTQVLRNQQPAPATTSDGYISGGGAVSKRSTWGWGL